MVLIIIADPIADPEEVEINRERMLESRPDLGYVRSEEQKDLLRSTTDPLYKEKDSLTRKIFAVNNACLFAMNLMNVARGLGLETHPMGGFDEACVGGFEPERGGCAVCKQ